MELYSFFAKDVSDKSGLKGTFSSWQGIVGIVLAVVGVMMIYVGIKVYKGFKIDFGTKANVPQEDTHVPTTAKIQNKVKTTIPDFSGNGEKEIVEWTMVYVVDGQKYKQTIPDNGYTKGQIIDIKYEPTRPEDYYLYDKQQEEAKALAAENGEEEQPEERNKLGLGMVGIAFLIIALGVIMMIS